MTQGKLISNHRKAVADAISKHHSEGRPVFQADGGYLVAIYPDGKRVRLKKIETEALEERNDAAGDVDTRRAERGGKNHTR